MDRWSVCEEQEKSRRNTASNLERETKPEVAGQRSMSFQRFQRQIDRRFLLRRSLQRYYVNNTKTGREI
jgi:hypothetical protein